MSLLQKYFPNLTPEMVLQFSRLPELYKYWNDQINVISRKDIDALMTRHVLHSLGIAKILPFVSGSRILDVGTGGGFPGIPLAILYPEVEFLLVDSIGKKIKVVQEVASELGLKNVRAQHIRVEEVKGTFDFIVSRAVARMDTFVYWTQNKTAAKQCHELENGILYLKGGDLSDELKNFPNAKIFELSSHFDDPFFETKKVVHVPIKVKSKKPRRKY